MSNITIGKFMTRDAATIGHNQSLSKAHRMMNERGVRHLPVLNTGKLVGVVSQRDLHFIETLRDVDPDVVTVAEAMTPEVFTVGPRASLRKTALAMAEHKLGSAIVMDTKKRVVGIFTTVDALRALAAMGPVPRRVRAPARLHSTTGRVSRRV